MRPLFFGVVLLAGLAALPVAAEARVKPSIMVAQVAPLTVKGAGFLAGERVTVTARTYDTYRKHITASRRGRFLLRFPVGVSRCVAVRIVAKGSKGSRATANVPATCVP